MKRKRRTWKRVISLVLCTLLVIGAINLSGVGYSKAEELDEIATATDASEETLSEDVEESGIYVDPSVMTEDEIDDLLEMISGMSDEELEEFFEENPLVMEFIYGLFESVDGPMLFSYNKVPDWAAYTTTVTGSAGQPSDGINNFHEFSMADGNTAFCIEHNYSSGFLTGSATEKQFYVYTGFANSTVKKLVYYSHYCGNDWEVYNQIGISEEAYRVATHMMISYALNGVYIAPDAAANSRDGMSVSLNDYYQSIYDYVMSLPEPPSSIGFSATDFKTTIATVDGNTVQKTKDITVNANANASFNLTLNSGMKLYFVNKSGDTAAHTGSVTLHGKDKFYLTAPASADFKFSPTVSYTGYDNPSFYIYVNRYHAEGFQSAMAVVPGVLSGSFEVQFKPSDVYVKVTKVSANVAATTGSNCYSLKGAVFGVYASEADARADSAGSATSAATLPSNSKRLATLTTDANGNTTPVKLTAPSSNQYYVKELIASPGYFLNTTPYPVTVSTAANATSDKAANVTVQEQPKLDPLEILVTKTSDNNRRVVGAEYTVKFYKTPEGVTFTTDPALSGYSVDRRWVFRTDTNGIIRFNPAWLVTGDLFYYNASGVASLPQGTVTIQETSAPDGYELDDTVYVRMITPGSNPGIQASNAAVDVKDEIQHRGDFKFTKVDEYDHPIANVKFTITDEFGESHTIWTDENGYYSTESSFAAHTYNTNGGNQGDGVWFGAATVDDTRGALPFGTYTIKEQRCPANEGKYKDLAAFTITISTTDGVVFDEGDVTNEAFPTIQTMAWDDETLINVAKLDEIINVTDTCILNNLEVGHTYTITGVIMDVESGTELLDNGSPITATKTFTAGEANMTVDVTGFSFNRSCVLDKNEIVIFETLTDSAYPGETIAISNDLHDKNETITFVKVGTTAKDSETGLQEGLAGKETSIIDTVKYEGLLPNKEYELEATLVYRDTGLPVEVDGAPIVVTHKFTPTTADGSEDVEITFDSSLLEGKSVTVFEDMYHNSVLIATHAELIDEQTVNFPSLHTTAKDPVTMEHIGCVSNDATIIDTIDYKNLIPGLQYNIVAKLVYMDSGEAVIQNGKEYEVKDTFTPTTKNGSYDVKLEHINAEQLAGRTVTVKEYIYINNHLVAKHEDLVEEQSIYYPTGGTTAKDSVTGSNDFYASKEQKFIDTCTYENLVPGKEYSVEGVLMTKTADGTGVPLLDENGKEITGKTEFTATKPNGEVEVVFTFDGSLLAGEVIVCFETYYYKNHEIFAHRDINDEGQTLRSPKITTKARDSVNLTQYGEKTEDAKITDTIVYTNAIKGEKYETVGWLMDKKTNSPVLDANGNQIKVTKEFVAGENGEVSVQFAIDVTLFMTKDSKGNDVIDKDIVVFEELYHIYADGSKKLVAEEKDINNADQTVHYQSTPKTGDHTALKFMFSALILSGAGLLLMFRKKKVK